jgi:hypothetical protein
MARPTTRSSARLQAKNYALTLLVFEAMLDAQGHGLSIRLGGPYALTAAVPEVISQPLPPLATSPLAR